MTVQEAAEIVLGEGVTFDTALPQDWWDYVRNKTGRSPSGHFVWAYDPPYRTMGRPCAITTEGNDLLARYNKLITGNPFPLTERPVDRRPEGLDRLAQEWGGGWIVGDEARMDAIKTLCQSNGTAGRYLIARITRLLAEDPIMADGFVAWVATW